MSNIAVDVGDNGQRVSFVQGINDGSLKIDERNNGVVDLDSKVVSVSVDLGLKENTTEVRSDPVRVSRRKYILKLCPLEQEYGVFVLISSTICPWDGF